MKPEGKVLEALVLSSGNITAMSVLFSFLVRKNPKKVKRNKLI